MEVTASFKEQTEYLVDILLGEEEEDDDDDDDAFTGFRCLGKASESDEEKQAIKSLAHRLRETGDLIDHEHLNSFSSEFQTLVAKHARDQACELFSSTVNRIFQNWSSEKELAVEENLLKISASLGMQTMKQVPSLIEEIGAALKTFIDTKLKSWVSKSNGWKLTVKIRATEFNMTNSLQVLVKGVGPETLNLSANTIGPGKC